MHECLSILFQTSGVLEDDLGLVVIVLEGSPNLATGGQYTSEIHNDGDVCVGDCSSNGSNLVKDGVVGCNWQAGQ